MTQPALQICFHDHCFDGVASAATFLRFYRERVRPGFDPSQATFLGMAHKAGAPFSSESFAGVENACVDFRYAQDPRLTWWFDHHQSAFETPADKAHFEAEHSPQKFWDPARKSCTKFLADIAKDKFGWDPSPLKELIDWAEVIDGALFPDAKTAVELVHPALQLMLLIEATKDPGLCPRLIRELSDRTLSAVLAEPWVTEPLKPLLERHQKIVGLVNERITCEGRVATFDLADLGLDNINKFIAYHRFPDALYTVSVVKSATRCKISLGSNPWRQAERKHNLARMAERFGGGGHPAVAAISFGVDELEKTRAVAKDLAAELRT
ncbi:MAG: hypothetical protein JST92_11660 [Deltaproteobacteria bacterium]|nr:hypothetical protein [Deltaproteobacteria bacterium]